MDKQTSHFERKFSIYEKNGLGKLPRVARSIFPGRSFIVVADERTWKAAGRRADGELRRSGLPCSEPMMLEGEPHGDDKSVAAVRGGIERAKAVPVAVGSGTINDLVKRASFEAGTEYICVPTAPSVDGFTSSGSALKVKGFKTTLACPPPAALVGDVDVILAAPAELVAAGFGDLVAKIAAGLDWKIADTLGIEPVDRGVWRMVEPKARTVLGLARSVQKREPAAVEVLYRGLMASGLAIRRYGDSRPASGIEHLLSHVWEMDDLEMNGRPVYHGFKVAMGTLLSNVFMAGLFARTRDEIGAAMSRDGADLSGARIREAKRLLSGSPYLEKTLEIVKEKVPTGESLDRRRADILKKWETLRRRILRSLPRFEDLRAAFTEVGCPVEPADIGLDREEVVRGILVASLIRKRYTVLDLAAEVGLLDELARSAVDGGRFVRFSPERGGPE